MALPSFTLRIAEDASDRKLLADVAQHGWHVVHIFADDQGPGYSFTVGLYLSWNHPELLIMGLPQDQLYAILAEAVRAIQQGQTFAHGSASDALVQSDCCRFAGIRVARSQDFLGYGIWFYQSLREPFPALQILWPDKAGRFPGDRGYDVRYYELQEVLWSGAQPARPDNAG